MIHAAIGWVFGGMPDTDDPVIRRRVVWTVLVLNLLLFVGLVVSVGLYARGLTYQKNLCRSQRHARVIANLRSAALSEFLARRGLHDGARAAVAAMYPTLDCSSGREIVRR